MNKHREVLERDLVICQERQRIMSLNANLALKDNHVTDAGYFRREANEAQERAEAYRHALEIMAKTETLPKTADGVTVWPGDRAYWYTKSVDGEVMTGTISFGKLVEFASGGRHFRKTYSTEQAARDAAGEAK
jgi:hypothetical protein